MQTEMIAPIDQWCSPLKFLDEEAKKLGLIWVVQLLDTALGDDAAAVCLESRISPIFCRNKSEMQLAPMT